MTPIPDGVSRDIDRALEARGHAPVESASSVAGGCIHNGARLDGGGDAWFLKWSPKAPAGVFEAEADGLEALRAAAPSGIRVPHVLTWGTAVDGAWLLMEYVAPGPGGRSWHGALGRGLAELHRAGSDAEGGFGWHRDNWIGSLPQGNERHPSWPVFWRDRRIAPQLERARRAGHLTDAPVLDRLVAAIPAALEAVDATPPSLVHGDLWSGNVFPDAAGVPVLIDPAPYRGHGEVDLAMAELFGGFDPGLLAAYREGATDAEGYERVRRPLYQLYYLLVHVNLFGAGYERGARSAARAVVEAVT